MTTAGQYTPMAHDRQCPKRSMTVSGLSTSVPFRSVGSMRMTSLFMEFDQIEVQGAPPVDVSGNRSEIPRSRPLGYYCY
jgi:hypothetical protein